LKNTNVFVVAKQTAARYCRKGWQFTIREGKGEKDRCVPLPQKLIPHLQSQILAVRKLHEEDLASGAGWVWLPYALADKYPAAGRTLPRLEA
jgi:hypothetical protein